MNMMQQCKITRFSFCFHIVSYLFHMFVPRARAGTQSSSRPGLGWARAAANMAPPADMLMIARHASKFYTN